MCLRWSVVAKGEYIARAENPAYGVFFIHNGTASVLRNGQVSGVLGKNDSFGARSLKEPNAKFEYSVRAISFCDCFFLYRCVRYAGEPPRVT